MTDWKWEKRKPLSKITHELDEHIMLSCGGNLSGECELPPELSRQFPEGCWDGTELEACLCDGITCQETETEFVRASPSLLLILEKYKTK